MNFNTIMENWNRFISEQENDKVISADEQSRVGFIEDSFNWFYKKMAEHWNRAVVDVLNGMKSGYNDILGEKPEEVYFKRLKRTLNRTYQIKVSSIYGKGGYVGGYDSKTKARTSNRGTLNYALIIDEKYILVIYSNYSNEEYETSKEFRKYSSSLMTENIARILGNTVYKTKRFANNEELSIPNQDPDIGWILGRLPVGPGDDKDKILARHKSRRSFYGASMNKPLFIFMREILKGPLENVVKANIVDYQSRWHGRHKGSCKKTIITKTGKEKIVDDERCEDSNKALKKIMKNVSDEEEKLFWSALGLGKKIFGSKRGKWKNRQTPEGYYEFLYFLFRLKNVDFKKIEAQEN